MLSVADYVRIVALIIVTILLVWAAVAVRRSGPAASGAIIVRCRDGHLFTTLWFPLVSFKAIRLGWFRFQLCPVGQHWTLVAPVNESELSDHERRVAAHFHDGPIP